MNEYSKKYIDLVRDLKEDGGIGLDLSPGSHLSSRAAKAIEHLLDVIDDLLKAGRDNDDTPSELMIFNIPETKVDDSVKQEDLREAILNHCRISAEQNEQMNINSIQGA